jgi:CRISPR-associated protein Cmr2
MPEPEFWKRKLAAFLHDPPHKPLDFGPQHEADARQMLKAALPGFDEDQLATLIAAVKSSDWTAAAADRFCFPRGKAPSKFTGQPGETFRHPLGGAEYKIPKLPEPGLALGWLQSAFGGIKVDETAPESEQWRQRFFLYWRRFMEQTVLQPGAARDLAYYPADTRIPDHTIWNHMNLASALEACRVNAEIRPAFLVLQLGPVQDFIAAARSTRDLWSGSYLLALLTANAIKAVTDELGADNIIFPALRGQGVFDILHQNDVYSKIFYKSGEDREQSLWQRMYGNDEKACCRLLNPTLPNRFVALVPEDQAESLGQAAEKAIRDALHEISQACFDQFASLAKQADASEALITDMKTRWAKQVDLFPQITWAAVPWRHDVDQAIADFANFPVNAAKTDEWTPHQIIKTYREVAKEVSTYEDNSGFLWMLNYHRAEFALAARRNTRDFEQFETDENQHDTPKDALTGKEEIIGSEELWKKKIYSLQNSPFKKNEGPYGAISIIKRLWWRTETGLLGDKLRVPANVLKKAMDLDSVADVAARNEGGRSSQTDSDGERMPNNPYVAILALDGDQMGKWVSGENAPKLLDQVSQIARTYLESINLSADLPRALSPSYHMQFSEALANFATYLAGPIVEHHQGQLIYAGGDDVLAMVPADQALNCARTLRAAFRGMATELPEEQRNYHLASTQNGFVLADNSYPLVVPGPAAEVSVGIAIGHYKHPLQAMVREAQKAEKHAKDEKIYNRAAFAVSLMKRGGETIRWGAKWNSGALQLYDAYCGLRSGEPSPVTARFPYALAALLKPYKLSEMKFEPGFDALAIIKKELETVFERQGGNELSTLCDEYLKSLSSSNRYGDFVNLFLTATFIKRERGQ